MKPKRLAMLLLSLLVFALVLSLLALWVEDFAASSRRQQREALESALNRSLLLCYALEGRYPDSLADLRQDYPLSYDETVFYVDYRPMGGNLMPDITILELSGG